LGTVQSASVSQSGASLYLGTSGFSFDDWVGPVYPQRIPRAYWLTYYEEELGFNALEVNYTYYQMPAPRTMVGMMRKTSESFRFTVKAHRSMTHDVLQADDTIRDSPEAFKQFREGVRPMAEAGRLGCVLAQFPYSFQPKPETQDYLGKVMDRLRDLALVVEFRHRSWVNAETLETLRQQGVGLCAVDEPALPKLMPWVGEPTSEIGYARFHGRNADKWFGTSTAERYNYLYSEAELRELLARLRELPPQVKTLYAFFNNCHAGAAAQNARRFKELLSEPAP